MDGPALLLRRRPQSLCQLCDRLLRQPGHQRRLLSSSALLRPVARPQPQSAIPRISARKSTSTAPKAHNPRSSARKIPHNASQAFNELQIAEKLVNAILNSTTIPSEEETLAALQACESAAHLFVEPQTDASTVPKATNTPASAILTLNPHSSPSNTAQVNHISNLAHNLLTYPPVFITPDILKSYTTTQALLARPATLPEAFALYASKPVPKPSTSPIIYHSQNPSAASAAIPPDVASTALDAAVLSKNLPLALDLIETSYRAPAFRRAKIVRRALPPLLGAALAPLAVYTLASQLAHYQQSMDPAIATGMAFAGILTYVGATATIGVVAVTTANDQMDRVTWAMGMPLRERWLREEERGAVDRVAGAWGFKDTWMRGEEEGEEWEGLREWVGVRGMVLDKVELMEGME